MEIEGIVHKLLEPVKGTSARGEWTKQEVVLEQPGEFGRKVCVSFWGDKALDAASLREGEKVSVSVNAESREYNGRWFTEIRVWKMTRGEAAPAPMAPPHGDFAPISSAMEESPKEEGYDDLPF